jgi:hypothetical protein
LASEKKIVEFRLRRELKKEDKAAKVIKDVAVEMAKARLGEFF